MEEVPQPTTTAEEAQLVFAVGKVAAEAVAAVDRAAAADQQQGPAPVLADDTGARVGFPGFAHGIAVVIRHGVELSHVRHDLQQERVAAFKEFHADVVNKTFDNPKITVGIEDREYDRFLELAEKV